MKTIKERLIESINKTVDRISSLDTSEIVNDILKEITELESIKNIKEKLTSSIYDTMDVKFKEDFDILDASILANEIINDVPEVNNIVEIHYWKVKSGIFEGHTFRGHRIIICNEARVWEENTGRAFYETNCELI